MMHTTDAQIHTKDTHNFSLLWVSFLDLKPTVIDEVLKKGPLEQKGRKRGKEEEKTTAATKYLCCMHKKRGSRQTELN